MRHGTATKMLGWAGLLGVLTWAGCAFAHAPAVTKMTRTFSAAADSPGAPAAHHLAAAPATAAPPPVGGITGHLESFFVLSDVARLRGWVYDVERDFPDLSSPISVIVDGVAVVNTTANISRPDLVPYKAPEPQHGIDVLLPPGLAAKLRTGRHVVSVAVHREAEVDWPLAGGPLCTDSQHLTCDKPRECACNRSELAHEAAPVPVAQLGTHILLDTTGLDRQRTNAFFSLHRPVKDPSNPILKEDHLWEDRLHMFGSVVQVSAELWRIYYTVDGQFGIRNCIAESRDFGQSWTKPSLGLVPWAATPNATATTANNIVGSDHNLSRSDWFGWIGRNPDPEDTDPAHRFVATMTTPSWFTSIPAACTPFGPARRDAAYLAFSADGLSFVMPNDHDCYLPSKDDSQNPLVHFNNQTLWFNRIDTMGAANGCAPHVAGPQRRVGVAGFSTLAHPPAPGHWPDRPVVLSFDEHDPPCMDLYTSNAFAYEDAVVAFPTPFLHTPAVGQYPDGTKVGSDGPLWTRFASSRSPLDGHGLQYVNGDRTPWIPRGKGVFDNASKTFRGEWDAGMAFALQGLLQSKSAAQLEQEMDGGAACVNARLPALATELTKAVWQSSCLEWDSLQQYLLRKMIMIFYLLYRLLANQLIVFIVIHFINFSLVVLRYYFGTQATHHTQTRHFGDSRDGIGRVTIPRDGFAGFSHSSTQAAPDGSVVVSAPFQLPARCGEAAELVLLVNVNVSVGGSVRVGFSRVSAPPDAFDGTISVPRVERLFANYALDASDAITESSVRAVASWAGRSALTSLQQAGVAMTLTIHLRQAEVFAWEWRCVEVGG